jgi:hypothetical protein
MRITRGGTTCVVGGTNVPPNFSKFRLQYIYFICIFPGLKYLSPQVTERCPPNFFFLFLLSAGCRALSLSNQKSLTNCPTKTLFYSFYLQATLSLTKKFFSIVPPILFYFIPFMFTALSLSLSQFSLAKKFLANCQILERYPSLTRP